ncbi:MAG: carboxypeptidase-like regulatory domain-containing protein [Gallionella sp.]|nr:carboxypeptidase-like regulatory domain-containing protein [Gallionella sp.]
MNAKKWKHGVVVVAALILSACATPPAPPPTWNSHSPENEAAEYTPYLTNGSGTITGQAFLKQRGGGVVVAAGQVVTLDPATSSAIEWWKKAGTNYELRELTHPSTDFQKARKTAVADASGKFTFSNLPTGKYFVRTILTWEVPFHGMQGGVLGEIVEVKDNQVNNLILNHYAPDYPDQK